MIRVRMQKAVESRLCKTQYGFWPSRSTSHALYLIRRMQDFAESKGAQLSLALLDWEKAFDKVQHNKLFVALERLGFSKHYVDVLKNAMGLLSFLLETLLENRTSKLNSQEYGRGALYRHIFLC